MEAANASDALPNKTKAAGDPTEQAIHRFLREGSRLDERLNVGQCDCTQVGYEIGMFLFNLAKII